MKSYNTVIIGGGASGCMVAMSSACDSVAIIDANKSLAKKIMVTGNGRCNLTNINMSSDYFNTNIDRYLNRFDEKQTLAFFDSIGLETYYDEEGRVYPISNSAKSVVDVILDNMENKVEACLDQKVVDINKTKDGFQVATETEIYLCKRVVVATGGNTIIDIVKKLGVETIPFVPSLTALKCNEIRDLNGVRVANVMVTASNAIGETKREKGEVLFKDGGISGIVIFNLSTMFARRNSFKGKITIDLLPDITREELCKKIIKRKGLNVPLNKLFVGMFVNSIANEIFRQCKINTNIHSSKLTDTQVGEIADTIKNLTYTVNGCYDNNQVYSGGVSLGALDENLMSKDVPNLYFTGEICNVDGVCGGYNLQWAWTSGKIVGGCLW